MNHETIARLNRINLEFYRDRADEFDRTRDQPWQGWERIVEEIRQAAAGGSLSVLDVGCGNGRFASYLSGHVGGFEYVGIDSSSPLLEAARTRLAPLAGVDTRLLERDLQIDSLAKTVGHRRFDLVLAIGLLHHVPSLSMRGRLMADLVDLTAPGGLLAIAFWQFASFERFRRRFVSWESFNRTTDDPVDIGQLEEGDHLLAWGDDSEAVRYCHWSGPQEIERLMASAGVESFELYSGRAGDRFNLYALVRTAILKSSPCA